MIYDISPPITERLAVWPGDTPTRRTVLLDRARGDSVTLSSLSATVHLGAHADAPSHVDPDGAHIAAVNVELYIGRCHLIDVPMPPRSLVLPADVCLEPKAERVLFRTGTFPDPEHFRQDFAALSAELIDWLAGWGVQLVGIDTPSVDSFVSKILPAHHACARHGVAILEGLVLAGIPEGLYELIAVPLPLVGFDASPVRALLRTMPGAGIEETTR
jgi:arylformamidase